MQRYVQALAWRWQLNANCLRFLVFQERNKRKAAAIKRAKNKDKPKAKDGEEIDKDLIRKYSSCIRVEIT